MSSDRAYLGVGLPQDVATQARALALQSFLGRHCIDRKACSIKAVRQRAFGRVAD
jgi:hypothetical protein